MVDWVCWVDTFIQRAFFNKFRDAVVIPDYLEREAMLISDIGFREKDLMLENGKINSLKFIARGTRKYYLVRILHNASTYPIFYTTETLLSNEFPDFYIDSTILLDEKGKNGFDKYVTIMGYVDEEAEGVEFELIVDFECNNEYVLI